MAFGALNVETQCSWAVVQSYTAVADMPVVVLKTLLIARGDSTGAVLGQG